MNQRLSLPQRTTEAQAAPAGTVLPPGPAPAATPEPAINVAYLRRLEQDLATKEKRLAQLDGRSSAESERLSAFPMGPGSGNTGSRKQHYRSMDAQINRSVEAVHLRQEIPQLKATIQAYREGRLDEQGRQIRPVHELRGLITAAEHALASGRLKGKPLTEESRQTLKETLRGFRDKLVRAERRQEKFLGALPEATAPLDYQGYEEPQATDLQALEENPNVDLQAVLTLLGLHQDSDLGHVARRIAELKLVAGELKAALQGTTEGLEDHIKQDALKAGIKPEEVCACTTHELKWAKEALDLAKQSFPDLRPAVIRRS